MDDGTLKMSFEEIADDDLVSIILTVIKSDSTKQAIIDVVEVSVCVHRKGKLLFHFRI